ncbi:MAG TPA: YidC/Oxa1 family membrane protein insertase [Anaerolineaceae bacterium]|nr:YidC/Oxa1 family membrane protein insertase [Anaerolineaceae bacterium]
MWDAIVITPFINVILYIYSIFGKNFGIAIILFTIVIRLITHPLMVKQIKGAQGMQNMQQDEDWKKIQEKHKGDKEKLAQEQMKYYKEKGINPFASCLPTLIQFPIIIALYQSIIAALAATPVEVLNLVRHVYTDFLDVSAIIPLNSQFLWMDLGQPERLNLPFLPFGIPVLAILVVISTYVQSKLIQPPSSNPKDQTAMMGNMMNIYMPFFMGYLALTLASGLSLYFLVSNLLGIGQYALLGKVNWRNLIPGYKPPVSPSMKKK